ncbi:unnamed protein product [Dibothriocephalus latus]|uniref:EF-hand domain-containing protein n=1 Tax=Dibothriocephalus latus TaxID=60516 RepID=A0A3P7LFY2_DIBLA|nr:unnamed protein product [Dibothriocephalus latus]
MYRRLQRENTGRRRRLVDLFYQMDANHDRILSSCEVNCYLRQHGYDDAAIRSFWQTFDRNRDHQITAEEYNEVLARLPDDSVDTGRFRRVFSTLDINNDGRLDLAELQAILIALGNPLNEALLRALLELHQFSPDAGLSFEDFLSFFSDPLFV